MTVSADCELSQILLSGCRGQDLAPFFFEVDHVEHDLAGLLLVGHLHEEGAIDRLHTHVLLNSWVVR